MGLEVVNHITDLVVTNPLSTDLKSQGDDHLRNIKLALKTDLPNITAPVTATHTELNYLVGVTSAIQTQFSNKAALAGSSSQAFATSTLTASGLISGTVADAAASGKFNGATGKLKVTGYFDATNGALIESANSAESGYLPLTLEGSTVRLIYNGGGVSAILSSTGTAIAGAFAVTGASTFTGAVGVTGAVSITASNQAFGILSGGASTRTYMRLGRTGDDAYFGIAGGASSIITGDAVGDLDIISVNKNINISNDSGSTIALKIGASNAVTLTGNITAPNLLGQGQSYTDVTGSRAVGSTYTNSTARPILVIMTYTGAGLLAYVDGVNIYRDDSAVSGGTTITSSQFLVPAGSTYKVTGATVSSWFELR